MNKRNLIVCISLFMSLTFHAQDNEMKFRQLIGTEYTDPGLTNKGIYLYEEFVPGSVILNTGDTVTGLYLRYNSLTDQLIWLTKSYGQINPDKFLIREFSLILKDSTVHFQQMQLQSDDIVPAFYQELYGGKVTLLVQRKVYHASDYYRNKTHFSVYKPGPQYYLVIGKKVYHPPSPTIKSMYALFPGLKEQIHQQVRNRHLKDKNEKEFVEFIRGVEENLQTLP